MTKGRHFFPYGRQIIDEDDISAVCDVLRGDFLTTGPTVAMFDEALAVKTGSRFAVSVSSGTAALHLAAMALELGPGDSAIVPSMTFLATANCLRYVGADIIFADVDPITGLLTAETLEEALSANNQKATAVFPVHLNGQVVDMSQVGSLAIEHGLSVVEDACHALGGTIRRQDGSMCSVGKSETGGMTVFSFHPVKTIAMGEGGAITTDDPKLDAKLRTLRNIGMVRDPSEFINSKEAFDSAGEQNPWYYEMHNLGYNYRASDIHCALGLSQLSKLDRFVELRRERIAWYHKALKPLAPLVRQVPDVSDGETAWHLCAVHIDFKAVGVERSVVMKALRAKGIGTQVHYIPVHRQPYYSQLYGDVHLPGADAYYRSILSFPLYPDLTEEDVGYIVGCLKGVLGAGG